MKTEMQIRQALREWVVRTSSKITAQELNDWTPLLEQRILSSLQVMDLIVFLESLTGKPLDLDKLEPGAFHNLNTVYKNFVSG